MKYKQIIKLAVNREVRIEITGRRTRTKSIAISLDFFVKDEHDEDFKPLIGTSHPKYWKFKTYSAEKSQYLQLEYSGVSRSQFNQLLVDFKSHFEPGTNFEFMTNIASRIKYLKGLRVTAESVRALQQAG